MIPIVGVFFDATHFYVGFGQYQVGDSLDNQSSPQELKGQAVGQKTLFDEAKMTATWWINIYADSSTTNNPMTIDQI